MSRRHPIRYEYSAELESGGNLLQSPLWDADFAYCIGLIASDGNLSKDGRHISITSKDFEIVDNCRKAFKPSAKITKKSRGGDLGNKRYFLLQFSDAALYKFMQSIGLTPAKSKTIRFVCVPDALFPDFLRGLFDGDGSVSIFNNKASRQPQVKMRFASASIEFLNWILRNIHHFTDAKGGFLTDCRGCHELDFGKTDAGKIIDFMYYGGVRMYLNRKKETCGRVAKLARRTSLRNWLCKKNGGSSPPSPTAKRG